MPTDATLRTAYDAIVIGARCAGASTAMLLARHGLRVLAVDRERAGSDTLSTHALMRGGVLQLRRWGLLGGIEAVGTPAVRSTTFHYADEAVEIPIQPRDGVDALYAPRRIVLDPWLVEAAREAGAEVVHETRLLELRRDADGRVRGVAVEGRDGSRATVDAAIVIGADGLRSHVARLVGAPIEHAGRHAAAAIYGHWDGLGVEGYHWYYRPGTSVGAIPTNDGRVCVFVSLPAQRFRDELPLGLDALYRRALADATPELSASLARARLSGRLWPFAGAPGHLRRAWGRGWALVGDAGFFRDPITAHGITDALRDAELLARAVVRGGEAALAEYQAARDGLALGLLEVTDAIASFAWDLAQVKRQHLLLSRRMAAEVEMLRSIEPLKDAGPARAGAGSSSASAGSDTWALPSLASSK